MNNFSSMDDAYANALKRTVVALRQVQFSLAMPGVNDLEEMRKSLLTQLENRILPNAGTNIMPAIVVFGGSSGVGKSTLINSILGQHIAKVSLIRPTTTQPLIVVNPTDMATLKAHALLQLGKLVQNSAVPAGLVIVDAPDFDTVVAQNREISNRLIDCADLWIFVTTAARYGDASAWNILETAQSRGTTCAVVLNRVEADAVSAIRADLANRLSVLNGEKTFFVVLERFGISELLPVELVTELKEWLNVIAKSHLSKIFISRTTTALLPTLRADLLTLADGVEAQSHALVDLRDKVVESSQPALDKLTTNIRAGRLGQGAPTTSWLTLASTGGALADLVFSRRFSVFASRNMRLRDRALEKLFSSVYSAVQLALKQALISTQNAIETSWQCDVVETAEFIKRARARINLDTLVAQALRDWESYLQNTGKQNQISDLLSASGNAYLLGTGAGGVIGVVKLIQKERKENELRQARNRLIECAEGAISALNNAYLDVLADIEVGNSAKLRLRATEFLEVTK